MAEPVYFRFQAPPPYLYRRKMFSKKSFDNVKVKFIGTVPGITQDPLIQPQPSNKFLPNWWKTIPPYVENKEDWSSIRKGPTAKVCPSMAHYFSQGFVIPAWCDMSLIYNKSTDEWSWRTGREGNPYTISQHDNEQFVNHADYIFQGRKLTKLFKLNSPWRAVTPKGYSLLQLPMYYHSNSEWSVLPGIIDTDVYGELNQQICYFDDTKEVLIKKGTPLAQYVPFKRTKYDLVVNQATDKDLLNFSGQSLQVLSTVKGGYIQMARE